MRFVFTLVARLATVESLNWNKRGALCSLQSLLTLKPTEQSRSTASTGSTGSTDSTLLYISYVSMAFIVPAVLQDPPYNLAHKFLLLMDENGLQTKAFTFKNTYHEEVSCCKDPGHVVDNCFVIRAGSSRIA